MWRQNSFVAMLLIACVAEQAKAEDLPAADVAERITANTVTVRAMADVPREDAAMEQTDSNRALVASQAANDGAARLLVITQDGPQRPTVVAPGGQEQTTANVPEVSVCSGVALEGGLIVTVFASPTPSKVRVTLPDGSQADAEPRVIDTFTGLCLLQVVDTKLPGLPLNTEKLRIGQSVLTAAASGTEGALVSQGILSGVDRMADAKLPPLLQSDVRTAETSHGAGLVDREGRLIGILVTTEAGEERTGWAYALPASHVARLSKAVVPGELVTLENQRPSVGLKLGNDPAGVRVIEAFDGMPAREAGIQDGDLLTNVADVAVRQPHQVQAQVLKRAPGDRLSIVYERDGEKRQADVALGTSGLSQKFQNQLMEQAAPDQQGQNEVEPRTRFGPQLKVQRVAPNQLEIRNSARGLNALARPSQASPGEASPAGQVAENEAISERFRNLQKLVETMQAELTRRSQAEAESSKRINSLKDEVERLRKLLDEEAKKPE